MSDVTSSDSSRPDEPMNAAAHVEGRLRVDLTTGVRGVTIRAEDGRPVAECWMNGSDTQQTARRIVACWNVCDGFTVEQLEALASGATHGCHCDLDPDQEPDGCVIDDGMPEACVYAVGLVRDGKRNSRANTGGRCFSTSASSWVRQHRSKPLSPLRTEKHMTDYHEPLFLQRERENRRQLIRMAFQVLIPVGMALGVLHMAGVL